MLNRLYISLFVLWNILSSCQPAFDAYTTADNSYFPLETGRFVMYDVQENRYSLTSAPTQHSYQLKELTGSSYRNVTGQKAFKLLRFKRLNDDQPWQPDSIWSVRLVNNQALRLENGQEFVKLLLPLANGLRWAESSPSLSKGNEVEARNVGEGFSVLGKVFSETATVVAQDDSTLVLQDKRLEVYARNIGLIYKERTSLHFCTDAPTCIGKNLIDYGIRQVFRIRTYGKE